MYLWSRNQAVIHVFQNTNISKSKRSYRFLRYLKMSELLSNRQKDSLYYCKQILEICFTCYKEAQWIVKKWVDIAIIKQIIIDFEHTPCCSNFAPSYCLLPKINSSKREPFFQHGCGTNKAAQSEGKKCRENMKQWYERRQKYVGSIGVGLFKR